MHGGNRIVSEKLIELNDISKSYKDKLVLENLNFSVAKGELAVIRGKSGSGKSTLMNIIGLLDSFDKGLYCYAGLPVKKKNMNYIRANKIGFVFQSYNLIESLSVWDNIMTIFLYCSVKPDKERIKHIESILEELNISDLRNQMTGLLSGGEKQRVAIARALAKNPELIVADEPTGNLDGENSVIVNRYFKNLTGNNTTIIVVTHSAQIFNDADNSYILSGGKIIK